MRPAHVLPPCSGVLPCTAYLQVPHFVSLYLYFGLVHFLHAHVGIRGTINVWVGIPVNLAFYGPSLGPLYD